MDMITTRGLRMPKLGLGTWRMKDAAAREAVERALSLGYRHIDTAEMYGNEAEVGAAIAGARLPRDDIHLTTKVWWEHLTPDGITAALEASLKRLQTDHVDLYLIHWPAPDMDLPAALMTLVRLKEQGLTRAIGVSNFPVALLRRAVEEVGARSPSTRSNTTCCWGRTRSWTTPARMTSRSPPIARSPRASSPTMRN